MHPMEKIPRMHFFHIVMFSLFCLMFFRSSLSSYPVDVTLKIAAFYQFCQHILLKYRHGAGIESDFSENQVPICSGNTIYPTRMEGATVLLKVFT